MKEKTVEQIHRMKDVLNPEHVVSFVSQDMHGTTDCARTNPLTCWRVTTCLRCKWFRHPDMNCRKGALVI